jgi:hypothetical protein
MVDVLPNYPNQGFAKPWAKGMCIPMVIMVLILYSVPIVFDFYPDLDSYWKGYGVLGIWGVLVLTFAGLALSFVYGSVCVSGQTVYACTSAADGDGDCGNGGLMFPDDFPDDLKKIYVNQLANKKRGWFNFPWSEYHSTLSTLNNKYLYKK